ncbi:MAG: septum formation initiator family protein [Patescibacteria group bacterium]
MKILIAVILIIILLFLLAQVYFIFKERNQLRREFRSLTEKSENLVVENEKIKSEIEYYSNPENLEKELRAKFNYKKIGEKMMIISP